MALVIRNTELVNICVLTVLKGRKSSTNWCWMVLNWSILFLFSRCFYDRPLSSSQYLIYWEIFSGCCFIFKSCSFVEYSDFCCYYFFLWELFIPRDAGPLFWCIFDFFLWSFKLWCPNFDSAEDQCRHFDFELELLAHRHKHKHLVQLKMNTEPPHVLLWRTLTHVLFGHTATVH